MGKKDKRGRGLPVVKEVKDDYEALENTLANVKEQWSLKDHENIQMLDERAQRHKMKLEELERENYNVKPPSKHVPALFKGKQVRHVEQLAESLHVQIQNTKTAVLSTSNSLAAYGHIHSFAYKGEFPRDETLASERKYRKQFLLETFGTLRHPNIGNQHPCIFYQCRERTDAKTGDTSYIRFDDLRNSSKTTYLLSGEENVPTEFESIRKEYLQLSMQATAATQFFSHSQFESRLLVNQQMKVTELMQQLLQPAELKPLKNTIKALMDQISQEFEVVKMYISFVIQHHERVSSVLNNAKKSSLIACSQGQCLDRFYQLISTSPTDKPLLTDDMIEWICKNCAVFRLDNVEPLLLQNMKLPVLNYAQVGQVNERTENKGAFGEITFIEGGDLARRGFTQFQVAYKTGIAIKKISDPIVEKNDLDRFCQRVIREFVIWSKLNHAHIVPLLGICVNMPKAKLPCPVTPWMHRGDLESYIHGANTRYILKERISYLRDVVDALSYCTFNTPADACGFLKIAVHSHNLRIVHGDLKANNVLLHGERAYLGDFGLSSMLGYKGLTTVVKGNWNFRAPEQVYWTIRSCEQREDHTILEEYQMQRTTFTDMYAFGMLFYEVVTEEAPFSFSDDKARIIRMRAPEGLPKRLKVIIPEHWAIMMDCWHTHASARLTAEDALKKIGASLRALGG